MGEEHIIVDEFTPSETRINLAIFNRLTDRYPVQLEIKGGSAWRTCNRINQEQKKPPLPRGGVDPRQQKFIKDPLYEGLTNLFDKIERVRQKLLPAFLCFGFGDSVACCSLVSAISIQRCLVSWRFRMYYILIELFP